jgi:hypothetical protein
METSLLIKTNTMKYIITEEQFENVKEKIPKIPFEAFGGDWFALKEFLRRRGAPPFIITDDLVLKNKSSKEIGSLGNLISVEGNLDLRGSSIFSLGSLTSVGGNLILYKTPIESLGNLTSVGDALHLYSTQIKSLGNLISVGSVLDLYSTQIKSLGNLTSVGASLDLRDTPISKKYSEDEIRDKIEVGGRIYL